MFRGTIGVTLLVGDLKASVDFYDFVLSFAFQGYLTNEGELRAEWEDAGNPLVAVFRAAENWVTLQETEDRPADGLACVYTLEVINLDKYYQQVKDRNGMPTELLTQPGGQREFNVKDRDGHCWSFYKSADASLDGS
jgi:uncharacterized glyoxalase superfamily protein PhnB